MYLKYTQDWNNTVKHVFKIKKKEKEVFNNKKTSKFKFAESFPTRTLTKHVNEILKWKKLKEKHFYLPK